MAALLEERTKKQRRGGHGEGENRREKTDLPSGDVSLQSLVESVKRKSSQAESKGSGKRRKL